jgi:hypothetical protein
MLGVGGALGPTRRVCDAMNPTCLYLSRPTVAAIECMFPDPRTKPWLRTSGLIVIAVLYVLGVIATFAVAWATCRYVAPAGSVQPAMARLDADNSDSLIKDDSRTLQVP